MKDLAWMQNWLYPGMIFGCLAIIWSGYLLHRAVRYRNIYECCVTTAQTLWLIANFYWMSGELHDLTFTNQKEQFLEHQETASYIMIAALCLLAVYYLIIRQIHSLKPTPRALAIYDDIGLKSKYPWVFGTWREYENSHILFWLGKDFAWTITNKPLWIIFAIPTMLIAVDFVYETFLVKRIFIEHMHYCAQFLWVVANILWAFGELFFPTYDFPYGLGSTSPNATKTYRWYSSWILIGAYAILALLYAVWIPLTCLHRLPADDYNAVDLVSDSEEMVMNEMNTYMDALDNIEDQNAKKADKENGKSASTTCGADWDPTDDSKSAIPYEHEEMKSYDIHTAYSHLRTGNPVDSINQGTRSEPSG